VAHSFIETAVHGTARRYFMTGAQYEVFANNRGQFFQCGTAQYLSASAQSTVTRSLFVDAFSESVVEIIQ
jgi:hypothetical protein